MAISILCRECKSSGTLGEKICANCGTPYPKERTYRVQVRLPDGRWRTKIVSSLELARELEIQFKSDIIRRVELGHVDPPTMDEAWEALYAHLKAHTKCPEYYEKFWRIHLAPEFSGRKLDTITPQDFDLYAAKLKGIPIKPRYRARKTPTRPLSPSSVGSILKLIKRLYKHATVQGLYVGKDNSSSIRLPRYDNRMTNALGTQELKRLLAVLHTWKTRMVALAFLFCLATGKRTGEVFGLKWSDVDFEQETMCFVVKSRLVEERQHLPMSALARSILEEAQTLKMKGCDLVFHTTAGKRIHYYCGWVKIRNAAKLPNKVRPHDLRHTFATHLASSGQVDIYTLQNLLGHKSITMTKRYAHLMDSALRRGLSVADRIFGGK